MRIIDMKIGAHQRVAELQRRGAQVRSIGNLSRPHSEDCALIDSLSRRLIGPFEKIKVVLNDLVVFFDLVLQDSMGSSTSVCM